MKKLLLLNGLLFFLFSFKLNATIVYVDSSNVGGTQNGTSWATAFSNFQSGIDAASAGDSVWVAKGTYIAPLNNSFTMKEGVKLFGGFTNTAILFSERNWQNNSTVLRGNNASVVDNSTNNLTASSVIDGFVITGGHSLNGGGFYNLNSSPVFINLDIRNNTATARGGGICNINSSPSLDNVNVSENIVDGTMEIGWGGGIYNEHSFPALNNVIIKNNQCGSLSNGLGWGGGLFNKNASPTLINVEITNNVGGWGCGVSNVDNSSPLLQDVTISNNTSEYSNYGGGMYNGNHSSPVLINVIISSNNAGSGGGIYNVDTSSPSLTNTSIINNRAWYYGGGICNTNSAPTLNHVIISGDSARFGGGMANLSSSPVLNDVIIKNNFVHSNTGDFVTGTGGGMYNAEGAPMLNNVTFKNNIAFGDFTRCGYGGAMYNVNTSVTLVNVMIDSNRAIGVDIGGWGGGICSSNSSLVLTNVAIVDNSATGTGLYGSIGGGIYSDGSFLRTKLTNVTISNNTAVTAGGMYNNISSPRLFNCIIYGNSSGVLNTDANSVPEYFYSLTQGLAADPVNHNLDGTTNPLFVNSAGDYRLRFNSPCINKGSNDSIPVGIITDLTGNNRIVYDTVDMGAFEYGLGLNLGNDTTSCSDNPLMLNADNVGSSYLWNTGETTQSIIVNTSGTYSVEVSNTWGTVADTIQITLVTSPVVNLGNDIATSMSSATLDAGNPGMTYLWNTGATTQTITVNTSGTYSVVVTNAGGCSSSDTIVVSMSPDGIEDLSSITQMIKVYPNPAKDIVHINISDLKLLHSKVTLVDAFGRTIRAIMIENKLQDLSMAGITPGIYVLKFENGAAVKIINQ